MNDLELLRTYEPILQFTEGEMFYPMAVEPYLEHCSLWRRTKKDEPQLLVPEGELTTAILAQHYVMHEGDTLYLRYVDEPLGGVALQRWLRRKDRPRFRAPGRLARVGLLTRLIDSGFDLVLLLRGKVPAGTVAAAELEYRESRSQDPRFVYYARVLRESGYVILHYLYFYAMNNWRTTFYGVNDHEADWEQVFIYLADQANGDPQPVWTAYSMHDMWGDDLRRRWDDPELTKAGTHPVVFVGAGSHASYFQAGEYLTRVAIGFLKPLRNALWQLRILWSERLGQGAPTAQEFEAIDNLISLPFVDYARGDGLVIGPRGDFEWSPILISDEVGWVDNYRGLWGLETRDPLQGEDAPAGPKYNRDGTIRESWHNPLGWAGLHKVPTPQRLKDSLKNRVNELQVELAAVRDQILELKQDLPKLNLEAQALKQIEHLTEVYQQKERQVIKREIELNILYRREAMLGDSISATQEYLEKVQMGDLGDPQAHIQRKHHPQTRDEIVVHTLLEGWSALSAGLLLLGFAMLLFLNSRQFFIGTAILTFAFGMIEAALRRRLADALLTLSVVLAFFTSLVLIYEFFWEILSGIVVGVAFMIIVTNWRELRGS